MSWPASTHPEAGQIFWDLALERDAIKMNHVMLYISLWSRDFIRLTGTHLIASRSKVMI